MSESVRSVRLVEIRDLDGPNLFAMEPVIKLEVKFEPQEDRVTLLAGLSDAIARYHLALSLPAPEIWSRQMDDPSHVSLSFPWEWRTMAQGIALCAFESLTVDGYEAPLEKLRAAHERDIQNDDRPLWVRDADRSVPAVGITGTNGKTTTTRLLAHIAEKAGKRVGWSSSTGVYIEDERVLEGDYTGPAGARRALREPGIDLAILETARGGMLLRGVAYESNDVGVFLNVSADHLSLQGVETIETLAEVKSIVVRLTRPDGVAVLNADDPLVMQSASQVDARIVLISQHPAQEVVAKHLASGGEAIVRESECIVWIDRRGERQVLSTLAEVPMTFGGAAPFMVENALAASAAALSLGIAAVDVGRGMRSFQNNSSLNLGRLNVFDVEGKMLVVDYAHNESGLAGLISFCRTLTPGDGRIHVVIGTAGDRRDEDFDALGRCARERADVVYIKDTPEYLRGRAPGEMPAMMKSGFDAGHGGGKLVGAFANEFEAVIAALDIAMSGDCIAIMCQSDQERILDEVRNRGGNERF